MALSNCFITLVEAKDYLKIDRSNTDYDDFLEGDSTTQIGIINLACGTVEDYIDNWVARRDTGSIILYGSGSSVLNLPLFPITALVGANAAARLANLQYRTSYNGAWTDLLSAEDKYFIDPYRNSVIKLVDGTIFDRGSDYPNIRIQYYAGYTTVPMELRRVALEIVSNLWDESKQGDARLGLSTKTMSAVMSNGSTTYIDLSRRHKEALNRYRRFV